MKIGVAVNEEDAQKKKGDLLENIAKNLLESQNYENVNYKIQCRTFSLVLCHRWPVSKRKG
jgi:hypothetical protein